MGEWKTKIVSEFNSIIVPQNLSIALDFFPLPSIFLVFTNMKYRVYQVQELNYASNAIYYTNIFFYFLVTNVNFLN